MFMALKAVIFDLDGTLIDTAPDLTASANHILNAHGRRSVSVDEVRVMVGHGARKLIERGFERTGDAAPPEEMDGMFSRFLEYYMDNIAVHSALYPGMQKLLDRCQANGIAMAVCTNKPEALSVKLINTLGLAHYFGAITGPDTIGVAKPDPAPYMHTLKVIDTPVEHSVMIGDSATDIATAKAAGVPVIAVTFGYTDTHVSAFDPDYMVDHCDEIAPILERSFGAFKAAQSQA